MNFNIKTLYLGSLLSISVCGKDYSLGLAMPLYLRKTGPKANLEREEAKRRELEHAERRAKINVEAKRTVLQEMRNLREIRQGVKTPPPILENGYTEPTYDPISHCWKSYAIIDNVPVTSNWKAWCVNKGEWLDQDIYQQTYQDDGSNTHDENADPSGATAPKPGFSLPGTHAKGPTA